MITETSRQAYESVKPILSERKERVIAVLSDDRPRTSENIVFEITKRYDNKNGYAPRITELKHKGFIRVVGEGKTKSGRKAELFLIEYDRGKWII